MTFEEWWSHQQTLESFCPVSVARTIWDAALAAEREALRPIIQHAAWIGFQIAAKQPYNLLPTPAQLQSQQDGIAAFDANPEMTAEDNHENWMRYKLKQGWVFGPVKDEAKKTHYDLVPFNEMPEIEQLKDTMDLEARRLAAAAIRARTP